MIISVINHTSISDKDVQDVLRALNRQIREDFEPYWHMGANLRLEGRIASTPNPTSSNPAELRGDAILYLWDGNDIEGALGYHDANYLGLPFGFVFTEISAAIGEPWSVTLSHEALELIGDANVNAFAAGPHPVNPSKLVFHWYEMCDAVQAESYEIDGVAVSNFVLPLYFTIASETGSRNDFLGTRTNGSTLKSFGVNPGGYIGFFDPELGEHDTYSRTSDGLAMRRRDAKAAVGIGRRALRYGQLQPQAAWRKVSSGPLRPQFRLPARILTQSASAKGNGRAAEARSGARRVKARR